MVNIEKLRGKIAAHGYNISEFARLVHCSRSGLYRKLQAKSGGVTIEDADIISKALGLTAEEAIGIFFSQYVA